MLEKEVKGQWEESRAFLLSKGGGGSSELDRCKIRAFSNARENLAFCAGDDLSGQLQNLS